MVIRNSPLSTLHSPLVYSLGLIGYPLGHSLSPQIHEAALHSLGISGEYTLYPIPPHPQPLSHRERGASQITLNGLLSQMKVGEIHGLNVTIPHKQNIIPLLDELTPAAQIIGAVNTIFMQDDKLIGDNTDSPGFWGDLQHLAGSGEQGAPSAFRLPPSSFATLPSALILGSGGSARAVAYALLTHSWHVTIAARRIEQARKLCEQLSIVSDQLSVVDSDHRSLLTDDCSLVVNTTPVGMYPDEDASPWPDETPFPENAAVYDLVYNPRETLLVRQAREAGLPATTGLGMLVEQAALAFERWTGLDAPRKVMMDTAREQPR